MLVLMLFVGMGAWAAEGDTHDFTQSLSQLLNNNASISSIEIPAQSYHIKEVRVTWRYNKATNPAVTIAVKVGSTSFGSAGVGTSTTQTTSFKANPEMSVKGVTTISFTNNCGSGTGKGTFYVTNVTLVEGSDASKTPANLSFGATTVFDINVGDEFVAPTLTAANNSILSAVTYTSSNTNVATVNSTTGAVSLSGMDGSTTIKATFAGDATYDADAASYTINVTDPNKKTATFDLSTNQYGWESTNDGAVYFDGSTWTPAVENDITLSVSGNVRMWGSGTSSLRLYTATVGTAPNTFEYGLGAITLTAAEGYYITDIAFEGSNLTFSPTEGAYTSTKWTGKTSSVTLYKGSNTPQIKSITVTYKTIPATIDVTIGAAGYATFVAPFNMDFEGTSVTAFLVNPDVENNVVHMTSVNKVPAGTALVVKGVSASIPTTATADAVTTALEVSSTDITATEDDTETYYYLGVVDDGTVGFRPLAVDGTLAAGKCFFKVAKSSDAPMLTFSFDDEETAITSVESEAKIGQAFNLAGQRVNTNAKGIIIVNGKKYFNK